MGFCFIDIPAALQIFGSYLLFRLWLPGFVSAIAFPLGSGRSFAPVCVLPSSIMAALQPAAPEICTPSPEPPMPTGPPTGCGPEVSGVQSRLSWVLIEPIAKPLGLRNRTTESQSARRTNDGDDYYPGCTWLGFSGWMEWR